MQGLRGLEKRRARYCYLQKTQKTQATARVMPAAVKSEK